MCSALGLKDVFLARRNFKHMTKPLLGMLMFGLLGLATAKATDIVSCSLTSGSNTVTSITNGGNPTTTGTFTCTVPTLSVGDTLTSVDAIFDDDYSLGTVGSNNEVEFSYSTVGFTGATTLTTTVLGLGGAPPFGVSSTSGGIVGQSGSPTCSTDSRNMFDCEEPGGDLTPQGNTFTVTGSSSWVSGSLQEGGTDEFSVSFSYTYSTPTATPEPATFLLTGVGGLLGLVLVARRRLKA